jgi:hypothetical protein
VFTRFVYRNQWFVLAQTEGAAYQPEPLPDWDESPALAALAIKHTPFDEPDGNIQGFASGRKVAINPLAGMPAKTLFHELAHVVLGHTSEGNLNDGIESPASSRWLATSSLRRLCKSTACRSNCCASSSESRLTIACRCREGSRRGGGAVRPGRARPQRKICVARLRPMCRLSSPGPIRISVSLPLDSNQGGATRRRGRQFQG